MAKILVVWFSRSGTTTVVAQQLARALGADMERIEEVTDRHGPLGFVLSALEAVSKGLPSIRARKDPAQYDLVVLGTPVWAGCMASPVRSWLFLNRARLRRMAFFATMGGQGGDDVLRELRLLCDAPDAPSCVFLQREVATGKHLEPLDAFAAALGALGEALGAARSSAAA